jgi:hypothetical protein
LTDLDRGSLVAMPLTGGRVLLPRGDRRAATAAMALAGASRPAVVRVQPAIRAGVAVAGTAWLRKAGSPPLPRWMGAPAAHDLLADLARSFPFDALGLYRPRQAGRSALVLLLVRDGTAVAFVKVKPDSPSLDREAIALQALGTPPAGPVRVPELLERGAGDSVHWLATSALSGLHRPARSAPDRALEDWLADRLGAVLDRPAVPPHWSPCHGDLAPWNLRVHQGATWLLDWESVGWGPPGADRTYFAAAAAAVLGTPPGTAPPEAVDHWVTTLEARDDGGDRGLHRRLLRALAAMDEGR